MANRNPSVFETAFDTYRRDAVLGDGGSGRVFEATDSAGRKCAIKCLRPELLSTEKRKRFKNELSFCSKINHPNIVKVVDFGMVVWGQPTPFYVMPLYAGTLEHDIAGGKIAAGIALQVFDQILSGVDAAHRVGVFHRDLKPANILRHETGTYVVADFGIARFEEEQLLTAVETKVGAKLLNIAYSAPEQRQRGAPVDHRADVYALGLMLNQLFTGRVPEGSGHVTIASVASQYGYLDGLVDLMRRQDPRQRPQSVDAVKRELIARGNQFVRLQELDESRRQVVPAFTANVVQPVEPVAVNWSGTNVKITLSRAPEPDWIQAFYSSRNNSYQVGLDPNRYQFAGQEVTVPARDERDAQVAIDQLKRWVTEVTQIAQRTRDDQARRDEEAARQKLAVEVAERERVERGNRGLRL